jgi:hypothetical protein
MYDGTRGTNIVLQITNVCSSSKYTMCAPWSYMYRMSKSLPESTGLKFLPFFVINEWHMSEFHKNSRKQSSNIRWVKKNITKLKGSFERKTPILLSVSRLCSPCRKFELTTRANKSSILSTPFSAISLWWSHSCHGKTTVTIFHNTRRGRVKAGYSWQNVILPSHGEVNESRLWYQKSRTWMFTYSRTS